tara:strand:+ start:1137 stop:2051 length:915 start_codon:yes stop_codon:yes gene_type:complete
MSILLTGSTGFIGTYLNQYSELITRSVIRKTNGYENKKFYYVDSITGQTSWVNAFDNISCVIHLAGLAHSKTFTYEDYYSVNVEGTINLAKKAASAGVKRFVFVSSIGVNGTSTYNIPFTENAISIPNNEYSKSKYNAEIGLKKVAEETGLEVVIVRPTLVYGANAPGNFGSLTKLVKILPILPFGLANNKRNFIAVQNFADLLLTCAKHPNAAGHTFLASDGETVSIKTFTNAIAKGLNKQLIQLPIPTSFIRFFGRVMRKSAMIEQLLGNLEVDSSNVHEVLGWVPPYTMEQAMASLSGNKK